MKKNKFALADNRYQQVMFFIISMGLLLILYFIGVQVLKQSYHVVKDDFSWVFQIDSIKEKDNELMLKGWAFEEGKNAQFGDFQIIVYDEENDINYYPKVENQKRQDVNEYFSCEFNYENVGFVATLDLESLQDTETVFQILMKDQKSRMAYVMCYYYDGVLYRMHPENIPFLDTKGSDLEQVVNNGVLLMCRTDVGMYVYQYQGELYYIAENWHKFNETTDIELRMATTQFEKLPLERVNDEKMWWSNAAFRFSANRLMGKDTGKYLVAKRTLPTHYSVTRIRTGSFEKKWIWIEEFRPLYLFKLQNE